VLKSRWVDGLHGNAKPLGLARPALGAAVLGRHSPPDDLDAAAERGDSTKPYVAARFITLAAS